MLNVLLTGGRAPATLELARLFHRSGHRVFVAESLRGHLSAPSRAVSGNFVVPPPRQDTEGFIKALRGIIAAQHIDLLVPTCEEIFYVSKGLHELPCRVFAEPIDALRRLHDKAAFVQLAMSLGLCVPESRIVTCDDELADAYQRWPALVLKPLYSRFASQTLVKPSIEQARKAISAVPDMRWLAQRFIAGDQICTYSVCHAGHVTAHTAYPSRFTAGQGATILFEHIEHPRSREWVRSFVAATHFTGQIALDFIESPGGDVYALECNPRATSGVHLLASRPDFVSSFLDPQMETLEPRPAERPAMLAMAMLVYGLPASLRAGRLTAWARAFFAARDTVFVVQDPLPALLQLRSILHYVALGRAKGISALQASTYDIEWNGE